MNNKDYAYISVIIPCYNSSKTIERAIESVINQTLLPKEIIVVDDCSNDNTLELLNNFKKKNLKFNIVILSLEKNVGAASARNRAWDIAKYDFIAFLDSDDLWLQDKLEIQVKYMMNNQNIVLSYGDYLSFIEDGKIIESKQLYPIKIKDLKERLLVFNFIATLTVMVKSDVLKATGGFDTELFGPEDWDLWIKISQKGDIGYIKENLAMYREHEGGISKNKKRQLDEEYKVLNRHVLQSKNKILKKYALWFYNLKLANFYFSQRNIKFFIISYFKMLKLIPFKIENLSYPLKRVFKI